MLIQFKDGRNYDIRFNYNKREDLGGIIDTKCQVSDILYDSVEDKNTYKLLWEGLALQSPKDNHCKAKARKVSLANAIAPLAKDDRTEIWNQYRQQVKK